MRRSVTDRILERLDVRAFYSQFTKLSDPSLKGECRGLCPLHEEKSPSFWVNVDSGSFKCFGCGAGGGPIQFYALRHKVSEFEAAKELLRHCGDIDFPCSSRVGRQRGMAGQTRARHHSNPKRTERRDGTTGLSESGLSSESSQTGRSEGEPPCVRQHHSQDAREGSISAAALPGSDDPAPPDIDAPTAGLSSQIYQFLLEAGRPLSAKALEYFASRSLQAEIVVRFGGSFIQDPGKVEKELRDRFSLETLVASGVFHKTKTGRIRFLFYRHPLLFPILREGVPVWIQGRVFGEGTPKYCNLAEVPVPCLFNIDRLKGLPDKAAIFVCEGAPDVLALEQAGFPGVGIVGSSGFKAEWVDELSRFRVHLALDNDKAGRQGTTRISSLFKERNCAVSVVELPDGIKDVNELFQRFGAAEFRNLVAKADPEAPEFRAVIRRLLARVSDSSDSYSYRALGEQIYEWFESQGGVFLVTPEETACLMFERRLYEIGNNGAFNALMVELTDLVSVQYQAKMLWDVLKSLCLRRGRRRGTPGWTQADREASTLYVNLHDQANRLARLGQGRVELVPNGSNPDGVMLRMADKMAPIDFDPNVNPREAVELFNRLVLEPLASEPENRLLLGCWILTAFFLDLTSEKALLKLSGHTGSGKTTAARLLSCFLYGEDHVESATVAYYYADAARNPYLICDNLETENMNPHVVQFLLTVATGIAKGKRKGGTDSETVREKANCLVAITAIEPLTKPELINRTYDVEFLAIFKKKGFMQRAHLAELARNRSRLLSGLFQLFAREVLPGLEERRQQVMFRLETLYPRHSKQRTDSFLTLMIVILEALLHVLEPARDRVWDLVGWWIQYQGRLAEETERDTNVGVYLLDALAKEMTRHGDDFEQEYYLDFLKTVDECGDSTGVSFVASTRDVLIALQILAKNKGFKLPFSNAKQLGVRFANEEDVLRKAGWTREPDKIVHGLRYHKYEKRFA